MEMWTPESSGISLHPRGPESKPFVFYDNSLLIKMTIKFGKYSVVLTMNA